MPYANTMTLLDTDGGTSATTPVTASLWEMWTVVAGPDPGDKQRVFDSTSFSVNIGGTPAAPFSFPSDASATDPLTVGLSINEARGGAMWRSGPWNTLPTAPIEVIAGSLTIANKDLPGLFPTLPFAVDSDTTVSSIAAVFASGGGYHSGVDFNAMGTTKITGVAIRFSFTGRLVIAPSIDVQAAASKAVEVSVENANLIAVSGGSILGAMEASLISLLKGFVLHDFGRQIVDGIRSKINAGILSRVGRTVGADPLPSGVTLSIRTISMSTTTTMMVRGALGAFGGVISKLPAGSGGRRCPVQTLVLMGLLSGGLSSMRSVRDHRLAASEAGRRLIGSYYRWAGEVSALLSADRALASNVAALAVEAAAVLNEGTAVPPELRLRCEETAARIAGRGSPGLRSAIAESLEFLRGSEPPTGHRPTSLAIGSGGLQLARAGSSRDLPN